jgi:hypothetical protein
VLAVPGRKILRMVTIPGFLTLKDIYSRNINLKNLITKTSLKGKLNLIRPITIYLLKSKKKDTKIWRDYPFTVLPVHSKLTYDNNSVVCQIGKSETVSLVFITCYYPNVLAYARSTERLVA